MIHLANILPEELRDDFMTRWNRIDRAWKAYDAKFPARLLPDGSPDIDAVEVSLCRTIIDTTASFLCHSFPRFEVLKLDENGLIIPEVELKKDKKNSNSNESESESESDVVDDSGFDELDEEIIERVNEKQRSDEEQWLDRCLRVNNVDKFFLDLGVSGAVSGQYFIRIKESSSLTGKYPRIIVLDPMYVVPVPSYDDKDDIEEYYVLSPNGKRYTHFHREKNQTWLIDECQVNGDTGSKGVISTYVWTNPFPPILTGQNLPIPHSVWGSGELDGGLIELNDSINSALSSINRILRFHAFPRTWGSGFTADQLEFTKDGTVVLPNPEASLHNLEMRSNLTASIEFLRRLKLSFHELARVPMVATGGMEELGQLSGSALVVLFYPLMNKTAKKRTMYGISLTDLLKSLLFIGGKVDSVDRVQVELTWPNVLPRDELMERQARILDRQLGIKLETLVEALGFNPDIDLDHEYIEIMNSRVDKREQDKASRRGLNKSPIPTDQPGQKFNDPVG